MRKIVLVLLAFVILASTWIILYTREPNTISSLEIKIHMLESQNETLLKLIKYQVKDLEKCGWANEVKYIKN